MESSAFPQDCQHLIQLSFAKIISSKGVKGGASLHKSLMVLHVLQKAREEQKCRSPCSSNSSDEELDQEMRSSEEGDEVDDDDDDSSAAAGMTPLDSSEVTGSAAVTSAAGGCVGQLLGKRPSPSTAYSSSAFEYFSNGAPAFGDSSSPAAGHQSDFVVQSPPPSLWQPKRSCFGGDSSAACQSFEMCCSS